MRNHFLILAAVSAMLVPACAVEDGYDDLSRHIDANVNVLGSLGLPLGSTYPIAIGDILGLDGYGLINTDKYGNYVLDLSGPSVSGYVTSPVEITVPHIAIESVDFEIDAVPDIFADAVLDIRGAGLLITPSGGFPCDLAVDLRLATSDAAGNKSSAVKIDGRRDGLILHPDGNRPIYISEDGANAPDGCTKINLPGFDALFYSVPSRIVIDQVVATPLDGGGITIKKGGTYRVSLDFGLIVVPLVFGDNMRLDYDYTIDMNLGNLPEGLNAVVFSSDIVNSVPFDMSFDVQPVDASGRNVPGINVGIDGDLRGGTLTSPATCPVSVSLDASKANLSDVKGLRLVFHARMSREHALIPINESQALQLTGISAGIRDGYSINIKK